MVEDPGEPVIIEKITKEELYECWLKAEPGEKGKKGTVLQQAWHPESWLPNKVFVCNESGEDIIMYVQRSNVDKALKVVDGAAAGSLSGLSVSARLEFELSRHRLQKDVIEAQVQQQQREQEKEDVMFAVGGGAEGAYITVLLEKDPQHLFCVEREVPCGYRLIVRKRAFLDPAAKAPATAVAAAAAENGGEEDAA